MIKKIKQFALILALSAGLFMPVALVGVTSAQANIQGSLCDGTEFAPAPVDGSSGSCDTAGSTGSVQSAISTAVDLLSWVVGIVSVIMIIVGGFRYITSGGASDKVTGAKNTIIYAIIGLVIVALAQFIVNFVLNQTVNIT